MKGNRKKKVTSRQRRRRKNRAVKHSQRRKKVRTSATSRTLPKKRGKLRKIKELPQTADTLAVLIA